MNLPFDFSVPPVNPSAESWGTPPIAPSADQTAKHCSAMGAEKVAESRETMWSLMLDCYRHGPQTDAEIAHYLTWALKRKTEIPPSTISARRSELIKQGKVDREACGTRKNQRTGVSNSLWRLKA